MLELKQQPAAGTTRESKQPRRLRLALVLLLIALVGVIVKDRQFWFGTAESQDSDLVGPEVARQTVAKPTSVASPTHATPAPVKKHVASAKNSVEPKPEDAPGVTTTRTALPPLDVEVVAGESHRTLHPGSNATKVEIPNTASASKQPTAPSIEVVTSAAERERMAADAVATQPAYPLLAQHMNVQGSVVLQAVIGTDGVIQDLRVVSGPAILTTAARQAVREWRFKPILQNGQPAESKAKITVNFSIKIADGTAKTTLAESRAEDIRIISR
jgi:protein TonB